MVWLPEPAFVTTVVVAGTPAPVPEKLKLAADVTGAPAAVWAILVIVTLPGGSADKVLVTTTVKGVVGPNTLVGFGAMVAVPTHA